MKSDLDLLLPYQRRVAAGVEALIDGLEFSHAALLRQEAVQSEALDLELVAPAACLLSAEVAGADVEAALPAAASLALLESMTDVFRDIAHAGAEDARGLQAAWGVPRALNAGDALFALAQRSLLGLQSKGVTQERVLQALAVFDMAARDLCEDMASAPATELVLLGPALALGALAAGGSDELVVALTALGKLIDQGHGYEEPLADLPLPAESKRRLGELASYVMEARTH